MEKRQDERFRTLFSSFGTHSSSGVAIYSQQAGGIAWQAVASK